MGRLWDGDGCLWPLAEVVSDLGEAFGLGLFRCFFDFSFEGGGLGIGELCGLFEGRLGVELLEPGIALLRLPDLSFPVEFDRAEGELSGLRKTPLSGLFLGRGVFPGGRGGGGELVALTVVGVGEGR